jgi:hypothetical protein
MPAILAAALAAFECNVFPALVAGLGILSFPFLNGGVLK